jgi:hypothetical protein
VLQEGVTDQASTSPDTRVSATNPIGSIRSPRATAPKYRTSEHPSEIDRAGHLTQRGRHGQPGAVFFTGAPRFALVCCLTALPRRR